MAKLLYIVLIVAGLILMTRNSTPLDSFGTHSDVARLFTHPGDRTNWLRVGGMTMAMVGLGMLIRDRR